MGRKAEQNDRDRYLSLRGGFYVYKRRVPSSVSALDQRGPTIRISLGTKDVAQARAMRDIYERADNEYWAALLVGDEAKQAEAVYRAAATRAAALRFTCRTTSEILAHETGHSIIARLRALHDVPPGSHTEQVLVGTIDKPRSRYRAPSKSMWTRSWPTSCSAKARTSGATGNVDGRVDELKQSAVEIGRINGEGSKLRTH